MNTGEDKVVTLNYESLRKSAPSEQPYRTRDAISHAVFHLFVGSVASAVIISDFRIFKRSGRGVFDLSIDAVLALIAVAALAYGVFVLWMYARGLRGLPTYTASRTLGRFIRWLTSILG